MQQLKELLPKEPSAAGMLVLSGVGGLVISGLPLRAAVFGVLVLLLHLFSFETGFDCARRGRWWLLGMLTALNSAPYMASDGLGLMPLWVLGVGGCVLAAQLVLQARLGARSPATYVWGALVPVLPGLSIPSMLGALSPRTILFWAMMSLYAVSTAAYVESRLPWRSLASWIPLLLWVPALVLTLAKPLLSVAVVEPTAKLALNAARNEKVSSRVLKQFGFKEQARLTLFFALLLAAITVQL